MRQNLFRVAFFEPNFQVRWRVRNISRSDGFYLESTGPQLHGEFQRFVNRVGDNPGQRHRVLNMTERPTKRKESANDSLADTPQRSCPNLPRSQFTPRQSLVARPFALCKQLQYR